MRSVLSRLDALETVDQAGNKIIYVGIIAPMNWQDIVSVKIEGTGIMRVVSQVFKDGTEHIPQQVGNKLGDEEQLEADAYLGSLQDEAIERLSNE